MNDLMNEILIFSVYLAGVLAGIWLLKHLVCKMLGVSTFIPLPPLITWTIFGVSLWLPILVAMAVASLFRVFM